MAPAAREAWREESWPCVFITPEGAVSIARVPALFFFSLSLFGGATPGAFSKSRVAILAAGPGPAEAREATTKRWALSWLAWFRWQNDARRVSSCKSSVPGDRA